MHRKRKGAVVVIIDGDAKRWHCFGSLACKSIGPIACLFRFERLSQLFIFLSEVARLS